MRTANGTTRAMLLAMLPGAGLVQAQTQTVDATLVYTTDDAPHFGEYSGFESDGARLVGAVDLSGTPGWLSGADGYWSVYGRNLGLDTYEAVLSLGERGRYDLTVTFDGIQQFKRGDARTPYLGGGERLTLPSTWSAGPSTTDMILDASTTRGFDQALERDLVRLEGSYRFGERWEATVSFQHEEKDGTRVLGAPIYFDAGTSFAALLPADVDYRTQDARASLAFADERVNASLTLLYTNYENENERLVWDNAFAGIGNPVVEFPTGRGGLGQAPDHDRVQVRTSGSWLPPMEVLRGLNLQWDGAWDRVSQNDRFEPYTVNPGLLVDAPLPDASLDGALETRSLDLRASYRPASRHLRRLTLRGAYHYDDRAYDRSRDAYLYVRGDGADQPPPALAIFANAYDNRREGFEVAGDYRLPWWRSKLTVEYDYEQVERRNAAVEETETDTYRAVLRLAPLPHLTGRLDWSFADRRASDYRFDQSYLSRRTADFINATPDDQRFDNHPALSQYHLANAETDAVRFDVGYSGIERWHLSADVTWRDINYDRSEFGLIQAESLFYGLDVQYVPSNALSVFVHVSRGEYDSASAARSFAGGAEKAANRIVPPLPQGSDPTRNWSVDIDDDVRTFGAGSTWVYSERLELTAQYDHVRTRSQTGFASGGAAGLDASPLPDVESTLHTVSLTASYQVRDRTELVLAYQFFDYDEDDWALDGLGLDTIDTVLTLGEQPDDEDVHLIGISLRHAF